MCGFLGVIDKRNSLQQEDFLNLLLLIKNRGPDAVKVWGNRDKNIYLGHCRLSILDLNERSNQPMQTPDGLYHLVYNGEVYNYEEIKIELEKEGVVFATHSDTEVVLNSIVHWGVEQAVSKFIGMFSFAFYDLRLDKAYLVRDRAGIKPLYYYLHQDYFQFASQLSPFLKNNRIGKKINQSAVHFYLNHMYVSDAESILDGVSKVQPGEIQIVCTRSMVLLQKIKYWELKTTESLTDYAEAKEQLECLLENAIQLRMKSDVPYGAFLSGGIDSSLVTALMQKHSNVPVKTFSIGFSDRQFNEAKYAKEIANYLGTEHHELYVSDKEALDVVPDLPLFFDEPFADSSQIPTYCVSKMAREQVKVVLSGDGGDELFAGYNRYAWTQKLMSLMGALPQFAKKSSKSFILNFTEASWDALYLAMRPFLPQGLQFNLFGNKMHKFAYLLGCNTVEECYHSLVSMSHFGRENSMSFAELFKSSSGLDPILQMQYVDFKTYLPGDILTKVDRASMAVSLEARVPLLDHRIAELVWNMPQDFKVRGKKSKVILRDILYQYVPSNLLERPKMGFGVPLSDWLSVSLKDWALDLMARFDDEQLASEYGINLQKIKKSFIDPNNHAINPHYTWTVLMFLAWINQWYVF